jgi:DNA-binding NtrC family response regulator
MTTTEQEAPMAFLTLREMEREYIFQVCNFIGDNKPLIAEILGISLKTLYNKLNQYYLEDENLAQRLAVRLRDVA